MNASVKLKKWGNSIGAIIPKEIVSEIGLKEREGAEISVRPARDIKRVFGRYPTGLNAQKTKDEMRAGWEGHVDSNH